VTPAKDVPAGTVFVDTGAWFSSAVPSDADHAAATEWLKANSNPLLTTDFIVDETLTLLRARRASAMALTLGTRLFAGEIAQIYYLSEEDIAAAWNVFRTFRDKEWSFTDCTSKVVMEKLGITQAFTFDQHSHQFGTVAVVPDSYARPPR
jgi:predicted nucleic acid-binding protein